MRSSSDYHLLSDSNENLQLSFISVLGDREEQQDSFCYCLKPQSGMIAVFDGMGGRQGGQMASRLVSEYFEECYAKQSEECTDLQLLIDAAVACDGKVANLTNENGEAIKAGSTCVSVLVKDHELSWCSVGDSRAYLIRGDEFVQLTNDHNYLSVLKAKYEMNLITKEEYSLQESQGEALVSYLGIGRLSLIDYSVSPLKVMKDDVIVVMSDGLYKYVSDEEIKCIVRDSFNNEEALEKLNEQAERSAQKTGTPRDNMTVAIVSIK